MSSFIGRTGADSPIGCSGVLTYSGTTLAHLDQDGDMDVAPWIRPNPAPHPVSPTL